VRLSTDSGLGWPVGAVRGRRHPADHSGRLCHLTLWGRGPTGAAHLGVAYGMDLHGEAVDPPGVRGAARRHPDGAGYTLEYAIPWEVLGCPPGEPRRPTAGDVTGCCWTVHWADAGGRVWRGQLVDVLNPERAGWTFQRADTWGRAEWSAPPRTP
jgi:hypothetical protein